MKKAVYTSGGVWQFYYNDGIRCITPAGEEEILFKDGLADFDITADENENIYILCQDKRNYFFLYWFDGTNWQNRCMLESSAGETYNKNFCIVNVSGWLNAFYTVRHKEKTLIVHHIIYSDSEPEIIEKCDDFKSYFSIADKNGSIYCFMSRKNELGYKKYIWHEKKWSQYRGIFKFNEEIQYISAEFDENNNYHIALCIGENGKYKAVYTNEKKTHEIISGGYSVLQPVIVIDDKIHILLDFAGRVLQAVSTDNGNSFLNAKYFFPGSFNKQEIVKIISASGDGKDISVKYTYGYETQNGELKPSLIGEIKKIEKQKVEKITQAKPEIEEYVKSEDTAAPPPEYKKDETDTDMLYKMISKLTNRIDELENKLYEIKDNREIKIVNVEE